MSYGFCASKYLLTCYYRSMLINVAIVGYGRQPTYEVQPPNCPSMEERIARELVNHPIFREAYVEEGLNPELAVGSVLKRIQEREQAGREKKNRDRLARSAQKSRNGWRERSRL